MKWLAGHRSFFGWYIVKDTPENRDLYACFYGDEYETFEQAKSALIKIVSEKIKADRGALKAIRQKKLQS